MEMLINSENNRDFEDINNRKKKIKALINY